MAACFLQLNEPCQRGQPNSRGTVSGYLNTLPFAPLSGGPGRCCGDKMHSPAEAPAEEGLWEGSASSLAFLDTIRLPAEAGVGLSGQRFTQLEIQSKVLVGGPWPFTCMEHSSEGGPRDRLHSLVWLITPHSLPSPEMCRGLPSAHTERGFLSLRSSSNWVGGSGSCLLG